MTSSATSHTPPSLPDSDLPPAFAARVCGVAAGAMCGLIAALIVCLILGLGTQPDPPSWVGAVMDLSSLLLVAGGACIGWKITSLCAPYWITVSCVVFWTSILLYIGHDESPTDRFPLPEPTAQQLAGYDLLLWLSKEETPQSRVGELNPLAQDELFASLPSDPAELRLHVIQHAASIRAAWQADTLGRECIERIAATGAIAERTLTPEALLVDYRLLRKVVNLRLAYALLLAEDEDYAGAFDVLAPAIRFGQELGSARLLVHAMIGTVVTKQTYRALRMIEPDLSLPHRQAAKIILDNVRPVPERLYTILAGEIAFSRAYLSNVDWSREIGIKSVMLTRLQVWRIGFHPQRTLNAFATLYDSMLPAFAERDFEKADSYATAFVTDPLPGRNFVGTLIQRMTLPALEKPFRQMWQVEDQRLALLADLDWLP